MAAIEDRKRVGVALFLILLVGVTLIAVRPVFAVPARRYTALIVPYSICVTRAGVEQSDGTVLWLPGYAYPGTPISQCQNMTEVLGQDVQGRTIVFNQFIVNGTSETIQTTVP